MKALGLECTVNNADAAEAIMTVDNADKCHQNLAACSKCNKPITDNAHTCCPDFCDFDKRVFDDVSQSSCDEEGNSVRSLSEYSSETGDSNSASDSRSMCQLKRATRSYLPKEELQRLREKERMAKRRQRARNRNVSTLALALFCYSSAVFAEVDKYLPFWEPGFRAKLITRRLYTMNPKLQNLRFLLFYYL